MTDKCISPLRRRMIEDMTVRKFVPKTQPDYIRGSRICRFSRPLARTASRKTSAVTSCIWHRAEQARNGQRHRIGAAVLL